MLRNKEKYLQQDDGNRSPVRKPKGKFPDIERALANWARNHEKQGLPMSDALIKEKLRAFSLSVGNPDAHIKANASWLEKFKQKNNLMGSKGSRKNSVVEESEASNPASGTQTPNISPTSPPPGKEASPLVMDLKEPVKTESPDLSQPDFFGHKPYHSLSNASLASAFNEGGSSSAFSPGPQSPPSPFYTSPDLTSPFIPQGGGLGGGPGSRHPSVSGPTSAFPPQRPRSQTFPMIGVEPGSYVSPPSSEPLTPKFAGQAVLDSSMDGGVLASVEEMHEHPHAHQHSHSHHHGMSMPPASMSMHPPPPPIISSQPMGNHGPHSSPLTPSSAISSQLGGSPSLEDTQRALTVVMNFFQSQPSGFVEPQEFFMMGKLMEKLQLQHHHHHHHHQGHLPVSAGGEMPGGMHRIPSSEFISNYMGKE